MDNPPPTGPTPAVPDASAAPSDPLRQEKIDLAREFAYQLAKGIKSIGLYRHNTARYGSFLEKAEQTLRAYTSKHGPLSLKVEAECFSLAKQPIFPPEAGSDNLPFRFYRDGVRQLVFRPEFTLAELTGFVLVAVSDTSRGEDTLSLLWKAAFEHIDYVVVEGFTIGDSSHQEVQVEVDQLVSYLYGRLRSSSADTLGFARLRLEDLDAKLCGIEQIRGSVISGAPVSDELKQKLQLQLADDDAGSMGAVVRAIFHTLALGVANDLELLKDLFDQLLDTFLLQEDYAGIALLRWHLNELSKDPARAELSTRLTGHLTMRMGEESRLRQLGAVLQRGPPRQLAEVKAYLGALGAAAVVPLLEVLDTLDPPESRAVFVEALIPLARQSTDPTPFTDRLSAEKAQTVRDMVAIVDRCELPERHRLFQKAMAARNPVVRQEVLVQLAQSKSEIARNHIALAIGDPIGTVGAQAARSLAQSAPERALGAILRIVKMPDFDRRDLKEREALYAALGLTMLPGAAAHFVELLKHKSLLARRKVTEEKLCAVAGLAAMASVQAFKLLQAAHDDKGNDEEVRTAARTAMMQLRRQLSGPQGQTP